jgi:SAM-dependent methyltransferase
MNHDPDFAYGGDELSLFARAVNWKAYFSACLKPYIAGDVAEVGAGIGGTTRPLITPRVTDWLCIEPDAGQAAQIAGKIADGTLPAQCRVFNGRLADAPGGRFDAIIYIDVIEHIEDDRRELAGAFERLRAGGYLIVLVPAFQSLYSAFDRQIGHYRRYTTARLAAAAPPPARLVRAHYLDSAGFVLSLANRWLLKSDMPTAAQIATWDRWVVPLSRVTDTALSRWLGRSAAAVWRRDRG